MKSTVDTKILPSAPMSREEWKSIFPNDVLRVSLIRLIGSMETRVFVTGGGGVSMYRDFAVYAEAKKSFDAIEGPVSMSGLGWMGYKRFDHS